jgi:hypothetical protein
MRAVSEHAVDSETISGHDLTPSLIDQAALAQARPSVIGDVGFDATRGTLESDERVGLVQAISVRVVQIAILDQELGAATTVAVALTSAFVFLGPTLLSATGSKNLHINLLPRLSAMDTTTIGAAANVGTQPKTGVTTDRLKGLILTPQASLLQTELFALPIKFSADLSNLRNLHDYLRCNERLRSLGAQS